MIPCALPIHPNATLIVCVNGTFISDRSPSLLGYFDGWITDRAIIVLLYYLYYYSDKRQFWKEETNRNTITLFWWGLKVHVNLLLLAGGGEKNTFAPRRIVLLLYWLSASRCWTALRYFVGNSFFSLVPLAKSSSLFFQHIDWLYKILEFGLWCVLRIWGHIYFNNDNKNYGPLLLFYKISRVFLALARIFTRLCLHRAFHGIFTQKESYFQSLEKYWVVNNSHCTKWSPRGVQWRDVMREWSIADIFPFELW